MEVGEPVTPTMRPDRLIRRSLGMLPSVRSILVIEDGRIAQQGDHHALIAAGGPYKRLYEAQNVASS